MKLDGLFATGKISNFAILHTEVFSKVEIEISIFNKGKKYLNKIHQV